MTLNPFDPGIGLHVRGGHSHASLARAHVSYPAGGQHSVRLHAGECAAVLRKVRAAQDACSTTEPLTATAFVRQAVRVAAGLPVELGPLRRAKEDTRSVASLVVFKLTRDERAAIDAASRGRDLSTWIREAVRVAAGIKCTRWSPCADALLTVGFRRVSLPDLLRALPGRSPQTISRRAWDLGLERHLTDERMTLSAAADFAGFAPKALGRMLAREGIEPMILAGPSKAPKFRYRVVRKVDVLRVVRAPRESVAAAAVRLGVWAPSLSAALVRMGHKKPEGEHWLLPPAVFDEAATKIIGREKGESLKAAARRVRVSTQRLALWLQEAGELTGDGPRDGSRTVRLDPARVDAVVAVRRMKRHRCGACGAEGHYRTTCPNTSESTENNESSEKAQSPE